MRQGDAQAEEHVSKMVDRFLELNPAASAEQIRDHLVAVATWDAEFMETLARAAINHRLDELYNEAARQDRTIPELLRKPS
jgi:uncharacterized coiled-coil protein SlyX